MYFLHSHNSGKLLARIEKVFVDTHVKHNISYGILSSDDSYSKTYSDFLKFFKSTKSGYFLTYRDSLAAAVMNAALDSGLRVPEDVEVKVRTTPIFGGVSNTHKSKDSTFEISTFIYFLFSERHC